MNRHQKEMRLAELTVSRDILDKQIEAIRRELASDGLQIWTDRQNTTAPSDVCRVCGGTKLAPNSLPGDDSDYGVGRDVRRVCRNDFHYSGLVN